MKVEFTGRQYEITPENRQQVETALAKVSKLLSPLETHVVLIAEKKRYIAEITITVRNNALVGIAEAADMPSAIGEAFDKIERQAVKYKTKSRAKKRHARRTAETATWEQQSPAAEAKMAVGAGETTAVDVVVHSFPAAVRVTEAHVVKSDDSVALRPMTIEEAVKEAQFRDREVFVFRDLSGKVKVLHRTKDGRMELIEAP